MEKCSYRELLSSDKEEYGGSGITNDELLTSEEMPWHDLPYSVELTLPPLAVVYLQPATLE
jgi:1,4-alpha-glucan branching enzyme